MEQVFRPPDYLGDLRSHDDESECAGSARTRLNAEAQRSVRGACASRAQSCAQGRKAKPSTSRSSSPPCVSFTSSSLSNKSMCSSATAWPSTASASVTHAQPASGSTGHAAQRGRAGPIDGEARIAAKSGRAAGRSEADTDLPEEVGDHGRAQPSAVNSPVLTERLAQPAAQRAQPSFGTTGRRKEPRADGVA
jgi:hypothetical protein